MEKDIVPQGILESKIFMVRGHKIMLDRDLAQLYGVETKVLNRAVKRNRARFPEDFMFPLTRVEYTEILRCQIGTLRHGKHSKYSPFAFTENGVAMLSGLLNSGRAVAVNIQIMRTFTKIRELLATHTDLRRKLEAMEKKYDHQFAAVFDAIKSLISAEDKDVKKIGFTA